MRMRPFRTLVSPTVALRRLQAHVVPVSRTELVAVADAIGSVAAVTVRSPIDVPPFPRASWDGYALRAADTAGATQRSPRRFQLIGQAFAEHAFPGRVGSRECVAVATGAPMPAGADGVVNFEAVVANGSTISLAQAVQPGDRMAVAGEDFARGTRLVRAGQVVGAARAGTLSAAGVGQLAVYARPTVAVIPNGDELAVPDRPLSSGRIYESNNATLAGLIRAAGGRPWLLPPVADDPDRIERTIRRAQSRADLVLVTGGSSVGEHDYLATVFGRIGRLLFHGIAIRPGKPTLAAATARGLLVGLPGHPTSCLVDGFWMLLPVLRRLARRIGPGWEDVRVRLAADYELPTAGLSTLIPLQLRGEWARPTFRSSASLTSLTNADGFALVGPHRVHLRRGERLTAHRLPELLAGGGAGV